MVKEFLKKFANEFLDCLYPNGIKCLNCNAELKEKDFLCDKCKEKLVLIKHACKKCGNPVNSQTEICDECKGKERFFDLAISPYEYCKTAQSLILKFKYNKEKYIADFFAKSLAKRFLNEKITDVDIVTSVPLNESRQKERGFNQAEVLSREFVNELNNSGVYLQERYDLVKRVKNTPTQTSLTKQERQENLKGAFSLSCNKNEISGKNILVIDDIFTTGATLEEISKLFKKYKAKKVYCLTVCHTNINREK